MGKLHKRRKGYSDEELDEDEEIEEEESGEDDEEEDEDGEENDEEIEEDEEEEADHFLSGHLFRCRGHCGWRSGCREKRGFLCKPETAGG